MRALSLTAIGFTAILTGCTMDVSKTGFESREILIEPRPNGWYVAGNLVFGGLIGWLVVAGDQMEYIGLMTHHR